MFQGTFKDRVLQMLNVLFGLGALSLIVRGFFVHDVLAALAVPLLATSSVSFVAFRYSIEQQLHERRDVHSHSPMKLAS